LALFWKLMFCSWKFWYRFQDLKNNKRRNFVAIFCIKYFYKTLVSGLNIEGFTQIWNWIYLVYGCRARPVFLAKICCAVQSCQEELSYLCRTCVDCLLDSLGLFQYSRIQKKTVRRQKWGLIQEIWNLDQELIQ